MRRLLPFVLAALLLAPLSTHATLQAQGVPSAVRPLARDTALVLRDSAALARQRRVLRSCRWENGLGYGITGTALGGAAGVVLGVVPAIVLVRMGHPTAGRVTLWSTAGFGAAAVGSLSALLGVMSCEGM